MSGLSASCENCNFFLLKTLDTCSNMYYICIIIINTLRQIAQTSLKGMSKKKNEKRY
jgi:hypothetical protein